MHNSRELRNRQPASARLVSGTALVATSILMTACGAGGGSTTPSGEPAAEAPPRLGQSVIAGRVTLSGTAPEARVIKASQTDPLCMVEGGAIRSETYVVGPGNSLQNVFLYVKDGLGDRTFAAPKTPVRLDQVGCRYTPHVFGVQVGQPVEIVNSDNTIHNVHAVPTINAGFNFTQAAKDRRDTRTFAEPEIMVPFSCDVHRWMNSYAGVVPHPYFAVSGEDGRFEIQGLPAGTFSIEAWHEQLGLQTRTATVDGRAGATVDFVFAVEN
jgi:plastocyanin